VVDVPRERFEELVADALDGIPEELGSYMSNVAVFVEDVPPQPNLLGLYQGVPLTARGISYSGTMPDRITIYRRPICAMSSSEEDVVTEVRRVVIHEVGHHFGIDDPRLRELGW
jgi:predicted Zn-dependent protease with MMP-like domain